MPLMRAINWARLRHRLAAIEDRTRQRVRQRLSWRETAQGCVLLRMALQRAGIDPADNHLLRSYGHAARALAERGDTPEQRDADMAFAAQDPVLSRRKNEIVEIRHRAAAISPDAPAPQHPSFYEAVAWAIAHLRLCADPPTPA